MADRLIKHIPSGQVFIYAPPWIGREDFVECANIAGDPLPDPEAVVNPAPQTMRAGKRKTMTLVEPSEPPVDDAALSADASRGLAAQGL